MTAHFNPVEHLWDGLATDESFHFAGVEVILSGIY